MTTETIEPEAPTAAKSIAIPAERFREMLAAVLPHADDNDMTLPALEAVRFEVAGGALLLIATDRYTLAVARCEIPGARTAPVADWDALLPLPAAQDLHQLLAHADGIAAIALHGGRLTVDAGPDLTVTFAALDYEYVNWRTMAAKFLAGMPVDLGDQFGLSPYHLAKFTNLLDAASDGRRYSRAPLSMRILAKDDGAPVAAFAREDWFVGMMMPVRTADGVNAAAAIPWGDWLAIVAPAEKSEAPA